MADFLDDVFSAEPEQVGPKVHGLICGAPLSYAEFEATFVGIGAVKCEPVKFEIVNEDGSVSPLPDDYDETRTDPTLWK